MDNKKQDMTNDLLLAENEATRALIQDLITELESARLETFKYVNKFLEVEEKWSFINLFLKKLNSIKQKQELCKAICDGFLKLTNSKMCVCCFFNHDCCAVEFNKISSSDTAYDKKSLSELVEQINCDCFDFIEKSMDLESISNYFKSISGKKLIAVPIIYAKSCLGYMILVNDNDNFYKENIHFINIFPEHIALILENISLYQESEKSNKIKIEFLAGISHEFKTPLNSIIGFSEILKSKEPDPEKFKYLNNIFQSSKHLLGLIQDVLDVSRSQYNSIDLNYSTFSPKDEIVQIVETLVQMIQEKNITVNYTLTAVKIYADVKRFRQLIYNLASNAVKFNKKNGEICIFTYIKDNKFIFEITDTGDGISKRDSEKIFDFFSQVNRNQLKRQLGSGVGLALCKMITDAHKGEIDFKSQLKKGSCFWFSLPIK